jgi:hypothetical protein
MDNKSIQMRPETRSFYIKFALMVTFIFLDVFLNAKIEFEAMAIGDEGLEELAQYQILFQFSVAAAFFLILVSTFPFRVGLLFPFQEGVFKWLLVLQLIYFLSSCVVGGVRMKLLLIAETQTDLFRSGMYRTISAVHKVVAPCYYAASLRSALALGHKKYYTKESWHPSAQQPSRICRVNSVR